MGLDSVLKKRSPVFSESMLDTRFSSQSEARAQQIEVLWEWLWEWSPLSCMKAKAGVVLWWAWGEERVAWERCVSASVKVVGWEIKIGKIRHPDRSLRSNIQIPNLNSAPNHTAGMALIRNPKHGTM